MSDWIEWNGGENPVPGKRVNVKFRDGWVGPNGEESEFWGWGQNGLAGDIAAYQVVDEEQKPAMRTFETGATRDQNEDKLDYKGFLSTIAIRHFAEYMHSHRKQADGSMRDSDNWKKGIPVEAYEESLTRHVFEWLEALERGDRQKAFDIAPAIWFNLQGWMHEEGKKDRET